MNNKYYLGNGFSIQQCGDLFYLLRQGLICELSAVIEYSEAGYESPDFVYVPAEILNVAQNWVQSLK
jgi:hypothetical protein